MAEIIPGSRGPVAETHVFISGKTPAGSIPVPAALTRLLSKNGGETVTFLSPAGKAFYVHRPVAGGNVLAALRGAIRQAAQSLRERGVASARWVFGSEFAAEASALLPHLYLSDYSFDRYKSKAKRKRGLKLFVKFEGARLSARELKRARAVAESAAWVRDLGNTPANDLGSPQMTRLVSAMARREGLRFRALSPAEIRREGMGGVLGVSSGSSRPPAFLILEHRPRRSFGTVVLVGKGITFDAGGISIKPAASMGEMKFDMMGAATVMAIVRAAHRMEIPARVVALAPLAENVPSGTSYRPGDILRMRSGKTVEVDNTDAEGRLILADALSYAGKFSPDFIVDFATLTGAVLVALGQECAGLLSNDDKLAGDLQEAGAETGDRFWRLPLWPEYREYLKSDYADMKNTGGRYAGTITASLFLKEFVPNGVAWAHCDVAGTAHLEKPHAGYGAGATGFGIAPMITLLERRFARRRRV